MPIRCESCEGASPGTRGFAVFDLVLPLFGTSSRCLPRIHPKIPRRCRRTCRIWIEPSSS
jgi:hypothetical protein